MGNVWFAIPSARPPEEVEPVIKLWKERGYKIALFRDDIGDTAEYDRFWRPGYGLTDLIFIPNPTGESIPLAWPYDRYPGYSKAVNELVFQVLRCDPSADWIVTGGDDVQPDMNHTAQQIAAECADHFYGNNCKALQTIAEAVDLATFGVMQATGDRWGESRNTHPFQKWVDHPLKCIHCGQEEDSPPHMHGAYIDRVCGSPWMGRAFCERINQGNGPMWPEYFHFGVDEELQEVAKKYGVLWQRPDLIHLHKNWGRSEEGKRKPSVEDMPPHLREASAGWDEYKRIYARRKASGFEGSEPL